MRRTIYTQNRWISCLYSNRIRSEDRKRNKNKTKIESKSFLKIWIVFSYLIYSCFRMIFLLVLHWYFWYCGAGLRCSIKDSYCDLVTMKNEFLHFHFSCLLMIFLDRMWGIINEDICILWPLKWVVDSLKAGHIIV